MRMKLDRCWMGCLLWPRAQGRFHRYFHAVQVTEFEVSTDRTIAWDICKRECLFCSVRSEYARCMVNINDGLFESFDRQSPRVVWFSSSRGSVSDHRSYCYCQPTLAQLVVGPQLILPFRRRGAQHFRIEAKAHVLSPKYRSSYW